MNTLKKKLYLQFCSNSTWTGRTSDWSGIAILETQSSGTEQNCKRDWENVLLLPLQGDLNDLSNRKAGALCDPPPEKRRVEPLPRGVRLQPRCLPESAAGLMLSHSERSRDARMAYRWQHSYKRTRSLEAW